MGAVVKGIQWVFFLLLFGSHKAGGIDNAVCLDCHADTELVRETAYKPGTSVFVDAAALEAGVHEGMECTDCHTQATEDHQERLAAAACADCHEEVATAYDASLHGIARDHGEPDAPTCADCHGIHNILPATDPASLAYPTNIPHTCAVCHADVEFIQRRPMAMASPLEGYNHSVHFTGLMAGKGATCTDCHQSHGLRRSSDPASSIHPDKIAATCGRCHTETAVDYLKSVHGKAVSHGDFDAPTCVDCHAEHDIRSAEDPLSSVYPLAIVKSTCVQCHENVRITSRQGLEQGRFNSYKDTYHGLANKAGSLVTAHCASCHGTHNILPSDDPQSTIHPARLQETCGHCHPGASERFTNIAVHGEESPAGNGQQLQRVVRQFYIAAIAVMVVGMVLHNGIVLVHAVRQQYRRQRQGKVYERFTRFQRRQHAVLLISFGLLVVTGFALKFPDAWWVQPLSWAGMGEEVRRLLHRIAGSIMTVQACTYLGYLVASRHGRRELKALALSRQDWRDAVLNMRYYLERQQQRPAFERYNYIEKTEFWALIWGIIVMGVSGLMLWFPKVVTDWGPAWLINVASTVHYYEAWLATLAIVLWHIFYTVFSPETFPLNPTFLDGKISAEEQTIHHPLEDQEESAS